MDQGRPSKHLSGSPRSQEDAIARSAADGPFGHPELPPLDTVRWVARRKAQVVMAVRSGVLTLEDACARYALSTEEFCAWQQRFDRGGIRGLRARSRLPD